MNNDASILFTLQNKTKTTKVWILASRPETKTLSVCIIPILVSTALVMRHTASFNWLSFFSILLSVPFIQIGMNLYGDAFDLLRGEKVENKLGHPRVVLFHPTNLINAAHLSLLIAALFAIPMMIAGGLPYVLLVCLAMACAYLYSGGPYPFGYLGISEILLVVFYGWISVLATYYIQTQSWNLPVLLAGTQMGCLAVVPLAINNFRDHEADALIQKKTLAVRFGPLFARCEITLFSILPFVIGYFWTLQESMWMAFFPCFVLIPTIRNLVYLWTHQPCREFTNSIAMSAKIQLKFGLLLILGSIFQ
jgi:1,4-dihydroxy-2-naphthoate polyprenyltransferase